MENSRRPTCKKSGGKRRGVYMDTERIQRSNTSTGPSPRAGHTSCDGCRYKRPGGVCADPAWSVGQQVTDDNPRLCYDPALPDALPEFAAVIKGQV